MNNKYGIVIETDYLKTRPDYVNDALKSVRDRIYDFVQFIVFPESYNELSSRVFELFRDIKTVIHAPFFMHGVDLADRDLLQSNIKKLEDSQKFADLLHSEIIVLHPGIGDGEQYLNETIRQFRVINDARIAVENLPYHRGRIVKRMELHRKISKGLSMKRNVNFVSILLTLFALLILLVGIFRIHFLSLQI